MVVSLLDRVQDVDLPARERLPHLQVHVEEVALPIGSGPFSTISTNA